MTLYRWDKRSLVSFLTVGRLPQEGSPAGGRRSPLPLGTFVEQRFDELWQQSKPMERFTHLPLTLVDATDGRRAFSCRFVYVDDCLYVAGHDLVSYMARHRLDQLSAYSDALTASGAHELIVVDDESELHGLLMQRFAEKYDASAGASSSCGRWSWSGNRGPGTHEFSAPPRSARETRIRAPESPISGHQLPVFAPEPPFSRLHAP